MALTLEVEERAAHEALAVYLRRLLDACEHDAVVNFEELAGLHSHYATVAADGGKPWAVHVTYVFTDDPAAVLAAIGSANRPNEVAQSVGPEVPSEKKEIDHA
jgi:3-oxoacyl-ACP reductase-like protein